LATAGEADKALAAAQKTMRALNAAPAVGSTGSGAKGGELDWANPSSYVKEFSDALVGLAKGKTTETPVKSQFGYHIIRLDDVREAQLPKIEDVKPQIVQQMTQQRMAAFQQELRAKAKVE
jgi:peptidyl-prolyl cis-trans isomerase C